MFNSDGDNSKFLNQDFFIREPFMIKYKPVSFLTSDTQITPRHK